MISVFNIIKNLNNFIWGIPLASILMGTHLFFSIRLKFVQKKIFKGIKLSITKSEGGEGDTSRFGSLATTLAATLGTGNIIGVSTAVALGGPGAIFWCWITGFLGMATTYSESYLSFLYRIKNRDKSFSGGPMHVLANGLNAKLLAKMYCFLLKTRVGCSTQSNAITKQPLGLGPITLFCCPCNLTCYRFAIIVVLNHCNIYIKLVPFMGLLYLLACSYILIQNYTYIIPAIKLIVGSTLCLGLPWVVCS